MRSCRSSVGRLNRLKASRAALICTLVLAGIGPVTGQGIPPDGVNYQGVLRDQNNNPLTGTYDLVFRFMDGATGSNEILVDQHAAATGNALTVSGGLFNVVLGSGTITDGSGPGTYTTLTSVFRDYGDVWLEIQVGTEILSPRTKFESAPYALNAANLSGKPASSFLDTSSTVQSKLGRLDLYDGATFRGDLPGYFENAGMRVYLASEDRGIQAYGGQWAGRFIGDSYGISVYGATTGGTFGNATTGVNAFLADGDLGIFAHGTNVGGLFRNNAYGSYAQIPDYDSGVGGHGSAAGGAFNNSSTSSFAYVASGTYKIIGSGSVAFVQNHPTDPSKVIVYTAPEGDEVAVYTRGSARLIDGEARVALGETFALVTNPDVGLTATATPRGELIPLTVMQVSPTELVVHGPGGSDAAFDYMVWGLRIGFEEQSIVQPKKDDSRIPSMHQHEQFFKDEPALRDYTALARFRAVEEKLHGKKLLDLSRAETLRDAIGVFPYRGPTAPPANHPVPPADTLPAPGAAASPLPRDAVEAPQDQREPPMGARDEGGAADSGEVAAPHAALAGTDRFSVVGNVETGDVVSLAVDAPGAVLRSAAPNDALVIGCVQLTEVGPTGLVAVATSRIALCRANAAYGAIEVGDLLSPSPTAGMAMKKDPSLAGATILGRAIEPLDSGTGLVRVLLGVR